MDTSDEQEASAPQGPQPAAAGGGGRAGYFAVIATLIFIALGSIVFIPSLSTLKNNLSLLHQVPEGHVGAYWRGGALQATTTSPGFHLKVPLITHFEPVQVTIQTDLVRDIPCETKWGVRINFERVEVVNRLKEDAVYGTLLNYGVHYDHTLIYDKIHHEINQFCSLHSLQEVYIDMFDQMEVMMKNALQTDCAVYAPGIEILSVHITKPKIPESVRRYFEQMEEERTKVLIALEKQRVAEKEAETRKKIALSEAETRKKVAISEAEKKADVSKIQVEQKLMEKDSSRRQEEIENTMYLAREMNLADVNYYKAMKEAEADKLKQAPVASPGIFRSGCQKLFRLVISSLINVITSNTKMKMFYGHKVPNMDSDESLLASFLQDVTKQTKSEFWVSDDEWK